MIQFNINTVKKAVFEVISLSTSRGRLIFFGLVTTLVFFSKYEWFSDLSLLQRLGWETAPSIGLTRAYWLFLHGRFEDAWNRNFLIYPILIIVMVLIIRDVLTLVSAHTRNKQ